MIILGLVNSVLYELCLYSLVLSRFTLLLLRRRAQ
jgi:hypothetical protein